MLLAFQLFVQFFDIVVTHSRWKRQAARLNGKNFLAWVLGGHQPKPQEVIYRGLKRGPGTSHCFGEKPGDVIVEGKRSSHIKMIA